MAYVVKKGDTLSKIAQQNGMSLSQLLELNPQYKSNPNLVKVGASITTAKAASSTSSKPASSSGSFDLSKVKKNSSGMVQTGPYTYVNADAMTPAAYQQALTYAGAQSPSSPSNSNAPAAPDQDPNDARRDALFASADFKALSAGEQSAIKAITAAVETNDSQKADLLKRALASAAAKADPIFKQQIKIALDELDRGFAKIDNDLIYNENKLTKQLTQLREDLTSQRGILTIEQEQELKALEREYDQKLETTVQDLAATGFTDSSRRRKAEGILAQTKGDLVESNKRKFGEALRKIDTGLSRGSGNLVDEVARLKALAVEDKTSLGRSGEKAIGSDNMPNLPGYDPLGSIVGKAERDRQADVDQGALNLYQMGFVM